MPNELDPKTLARLAFQLYPSIFTGGEGSVDVESLLTRIHAIRRGLLPEHEFFAILSWLGQCATIHRLDQTPLPIENSANLRAPDFLVFANYEGRVVPMLIECKATADNKLEWSEKYLNSLKDFASVLNLPLLLAWKWNNMWLVVDSSHFEKKVTGFHLDYDVALKENLMSLLFGNRWIKVNDEASFRIDAKVIDATLDPSEKLFDEGEYTFQIESAGFYVGQKLIDTVSGRCSEVLFSTFVENEVQKLEGTRARIIYRPIEGSTAVQLYDLLLIDLYIKSSGEDEIVWPEALVKGPFDSSGEIFRNALSEAGTSQFIDMVLKQVPATVPEYLK